VTAVRHALLTVLVNIAIRVMVDVCGAVTQTTV
jgi:hypothetical protein